MREAGVGCSRVSTLASGWHRVRTFPAPLSLVIDPTSSDTVYAATSHSGVFRSVDGGVAWQSTNAGLDSPDALDLIIGPTGCIANLDCERAISWYRMRRCFRRWRRGRSWSG